MNHPTKPNPTDDYCFVEGVIINKRVQRPFREYIDHSTGTAHTATFSGYCISNMDVKDADSGEVLTNLPASLRCEAGDLVRVTVQIIKRREG